MAILGLVGIGGLMLVALLLIREHELDHEREYDEHSEAERHWW